MKLHFIIVSMLFGLFQPPLFAQSSKKNNEEVNTGFTYNYMVFVEGGTFEMGCNTGEGDEEPAHTVVINSFFISKYEVTFQEYDAYCDSTGKAKPDDIGWGRGLRPVINISWNEAQDYCKWLSHKLGKTFRLPTEEEWEYAAKGGILSKGFLFAGSDNLPEIAWYEKNSREKTNPVGKKKPNELGLYDMTGNVGEWCSNWYRTYNYDTLNSGKESIYDTYRVYRGGSFDYADRDLRTTFRASKLPETGDCVIGFRLVCNP